MPRAERDERLPLALQVLLEELRGLEACLAQAEAVADAGDRDARRGDLTRAVDRYLRLEDEVFFPVLDRRGCEHAAASASHSRLRAALTQVGERVDDAEIEPLRAAIHAHRREQEQHTLPRIAPQLGDELPGLALELEEVRRRMQGAWGV